MTSTLAIYDNNSQLIAYNANLDITSDVLAEATELQPGLLTNSYVITSRQDMRTVAVFLKLNSLCRVTNAIDLTIVDSISNEYRFNINYQFQSTTTNTRWTLSTWTSEALPLLSMQSLYPAFNWAEREAWDMYGVFFIKHPDLRRILTDYGFVGFPLRKDFPLSGFREVQYEDSIKQVEYSNAELTQSYRLLSFANPWSK